MFNITLVCTIHKECGNCNSMELYKIIELINPEIIFEELSPTVFEQCYGGEDRRTLETSAIKKYLQNHRIEHIPVDTFSWDSYYTDIDYMYDKIVNNNRIFECRCIRDLLDKQSLLKNKQGFAFLNSNQNDKLFEEFNILKEQILCIINDENLFRIHRLEKKIIEKREYEIIENIYAFSKRHTYNQALLFIGSGHRESLIEKIYEYEKKEKLKLNWNVHYLLDS